RQPGRSAPLAEVSNRIETLPCGACAIAQAHRVGPLPNVRVRDNLLPMDNNSISRVFADVAALMQAKGENVFKVRAHSNAADAIKSLSFPISDIVDDTGRLREIPGFGKAIVEKTQELVRTGRLGLLERLQEEVPDGVLLLMQIPGIGPKTAMIAAKELGISSFEQLAASIESEVFQTLPRITKKVAASVLRHTRMRIDQGSRIGLGRAAEAADGVMVELGDRCPDIEHIDVAGSVRRGAELVGDINIVCAAPDDDAVTAVIDAFTTLSNTHDVLARDSSSVRFADRHGLEFSIRIVSPGAFAAALVYATGSIAHGTRLEQLAAAAGLRLTAAGLFDAESGRTIEAATEQDVYERLGLCFIPAELREDSGEFERAVLRDSGGGPGDGFANIVKFDDIRGDLHSHTDWSDGRFPMEDMVAAAQQHGFEYLAITDHSPSATVANGLKPDRLLEHSEAVRAMSVTISVASPEQDRRQSIKLLTGTEMDIKPDGSLDYDDELLAGLDIVVASIHSGMDQDEATMTRRVIAAMESPHVDVICHLTTRLLERRAPVMMDIDAVLEAAVRTGTVMEINASPERLDLKADHVKRAVELGVVFAISTDSHRTGQFDNMQFGVQTAVRGWVEKTRVINTLPFDDLKRCLELPKPDRYGFIYSRG
ncbi:MAG: DNA polymerase/3'-5' exonuclease PolX, partial [Chloroflexi bacterium]|nr:DNA polymerase/3'-5' exonuclease PolX [Chloroflexota bacterium]